MPSIEDLLSNPGSSCFYLNRRYYYAIGNTPSVDLTEGCQVPRHAKFLLLGCGDIRNILQTVHELSQLKPQPRSLTFHLNDIDDVLLARNAVLLQIINILDPSRREDVEFLWNVWYNLHLSEDNFQRLKLVLSHILDNTSLRFTFESDECSTAVKTVVKYWLEMKMDGKEAQSQREKFICKKMEAESNAELAFFDAVNSLTFSAGVFHRPLNKHDSEEVTTYFRNGSTDDDSTGYTNPTFFCPHVSGWRVHPASLPYHAFGKFTYMFEDKLSLKDNCILQLQSQLTSWKTFTKSGTIKVSLWDGDALTLCYRRMPHDKKFHFINASNLCDHITLLNVLLACSGRLERNGLLAVQTMHLPGDKGYSGSVDRYLEAKLGFSAHFFPTYLGLHLAEDFELGTSDISSRTLSYGMHELTIKWIAAEPCSSIISVEDSPEIKKIFEELSRACFSMFGPKVKNPLNTPLTLIYLMRQLSKKLDGGVAPLLEIAERCLPTETTKSGFTFRPLEMEWKVLTQYFFPDETASNVEDEVVKVQIPVRTNILMPLISKSPAGLDVQHRAILMQDFYEPLDVLQNHYKKPWHILTVIDFDHETNTVTCVLLRSQLRCFGEETYCQFFLPEGLPSTLVTIGAFISIVSYSETIGIRNNSQCATRSEKPQKRQEPDVHLTLSETSDAYRVLVKSTNTELVIQRFEYCVDETTRRIINFTCQISQDFFKKPISAEIKITVSCPLQPTGSVMCCRRNMVTLTKALNFVQGLVILPSRTMNISSFPRFKATQAKLNEVAGGMFSSGDELRRLAVKNEYHASGNALFEVKETLKQLINWAFYPPQHTPNVCAYRLMRDQRTKQQQYGFFPDDIFIAVKGVHNVRGTLTLDIVWLDFEIYRKQVPYVSGIETEDARRFVTENGGSMSSQGDTLHLFFISTEEAVLLKKLLRYNSSRSVQRLDKYRSPRWCFNSFLQPLYSVTSNFEKMDFLFGKDQGQNMANLAKLHDQVEDSGRLQMLTRKCCCCGITGFDMRKCSRCKMAFYCSERCQKKDWKSGHKTVCGNLQLNKSD